MAEWYAVAVGMQAGGSILSAQASADAMERQAEIARLQGRISMAQAKFAARMQLKAGREQATYLRRQSARRTGEAVQSVSESGVELSGSPALAIGEQVLRDEHAAATVITNARMRASAEEARGRGAEAGAEAQHDALLEQAGITRRAGFLEAIGIAMSGAARYHGMTGGSGDPGYMNDGGYTDSGFYSGY